MSEIHDKIGAALRMERERLGLTIEYFATELRISEAHLAGIEAGQVDALPSELYFNLFGKSYAAALGIDYVATMDAIRADMEGLPPPEAAEAEPRVETRVEEAPLRAPRPPSRRDVVPFENVRNSWIGLIVVGIIAIGVLILAWYLLGPGGKYSIFSGKSSGSGEVEPADGEGVVAFDTLGASLRLRMIARDRSYAIVLADDDTALSTSLKPMREYLVGADDHLLVTLASPLAVDLFVNNQQLDLSDPETGTVNEVLVTADNMGLYIKRPRVDSMLIDTVRLDSLGNPVIDTVLLYDSVLSAQPDDLDSIAHEGDSGALPR